MCAASLATVLLAATCGQFAGPVLGPGEVASPLTVTGVITDVDGSPAAGATVVLSQVDFGVSFSIGEKPGSDDGRITPSNGHQVATVETGEDGSYRFEAVDLKYVPKMFPDRRPLVMFEVFAHRPGAGVAWKEPYKYYPNGVPDGVEDAFDPDDDVTVDLRLPPERPLRGRLVADDGEPIVSAQVDVYGANLLDGTWDFKDRDRSWRKLASAYPGFPSPAYLDGLVSNRTDEDGAFVIGGFPEDSVLHLMISAKSFPSASVTAINGTDVYAAAPEGWNITRGEVNLTLKRYPQVQYRIVQGDTGETAAGAQVSVRARVDDQERLAEWGETDAEGAVTLSAITAEHTVSVVPPSDSPYMPATDTAILDPAAGVAGPVTVRLPRAAELTVTAVGEDSGEPVAGLWLWREPLDAGLPEQEARPRVHEVSVTRADWRSGMRARRSTGPDGVVRHKFRPGRYRVGLSYDVSHGELSAEEKADGHLWHGSRTEEVTLTAGRTTALTLRVPGR